MRKRTCPNCGRDPGINAPPGPCFICMGARCYHCGALATHFIEGPYAAYRHTACDTCHDRS